VIFREPSRFSSPSPHWGMWATRFEGVGRMWEGTRTLGETRDKGRPVRCVGEGVEKMTPSAISISHAPNSFFVTTGTFGSRRNIWFRRPHSLSLPTTTQTGQTCRRNMSFRRVRRMFTQQKSNSCWVLLCVDRRAHTRHVVSSATSILAYENFHDTPILRVPSNLRPYDWSNAPPQRPLALN